MQLPEVDGIRITSVVDNFVDLLLRDEGPARRRPRQAKTYERCLCAEHGLAELVESRRGGHSVPLMFDFGASPMVFLHNIVPMHCTGIETNQALRERAPDKVFFNSAGTRYELDASER